MADVLFDLPDGSQSGSLYLTTSSPFRFITGSLPASAINAEVSLRGSAFTSDVESIAIIGNTFVVPNPEYFPEGLELNAGQNIVSIRAILITGATEPSTATVVRVDSSPTVEVLAPTGLQAERRSDFVRFSIERFPDDLGNFNDGIVGYNLYVSTTSGGGASGYSRVNLRTITEFTENSSLSSVGEFVTTSTLDRDAPDPAVNIRYIVQQLRNDGTLISTDYDELIRVPDTFREVQTRINAFDVEPVRIYTFDHYRNGTPTSNPATVFNSSINNTPNESLLYYVATAIYYDALTQSEYESSFSPEVASRPADVVNVVGNFPVASLDTIRNRVVQSIFRANPDVSVQPGSVLRDTFIDPLAAESERLQFIVDFLYRCSSFSTLLSVDDPQNSGVSVPVAQSAYKRALRQAMFLPSDSATQALIDRAFDKIASDFGVSRRTGTKAQGSLTFFVRNIPNRTITVPLGTQVAVNGIGFVTTQQGQIPVSSVASFFDPVNNRYSFNVPVQAILPGSQGNLAKGQLRGTLNGVNFINESRFFGGTDQDTNRQLAERALNRLSSVDTGTIRGIREIAATSPGVIQARIIGPGDPLMFRDVDANGNHLGGKVDVWVQGSSDAVVSDTFAFTFDVVQDAQFIPVGNPSNLIFRCISPRVTPDNPIVEILDDPNLSLGLRNAISGLFFDVNNVTFLDYRTVQLDTSLPQPPYNITDVILGDFRFRTGNTFIFDQQPVQRIVSVSGQVSGTLSPNQYELLRSESFLLKGRSVQASDSLRLTLPSTEEVSIVSESHVMIGSNPEFLNFLGVNPYSIRVFNADRTIEYVGSFNPTVSADFTILPGTNTTATAIIRTSTTIIQNGQEVLVDYDHAENFVVRYEINAVLGAVQDRIDGFKHLTADIIAKAALPVPVDIGATIVLDASANRGTVDSRIRSSLSDFFNQFRTDNPVRQSDIIAVLEEVQGVSYVVQPLTKMCRADGAYVVNEDLPSAFSGDSFLVSTWSNTNTLVWLLLTPLSASTTTAGGPDNQFRAVYSDDVEMDLTRIQPSLLANAPNSAYIIGSDGLEIPGYSDNVTLSSQGFTGARAIQRRIEITANRVLLSLPAGESPTEHTYSVTYIVSGNSGVRNINPGPTEFLTLGTVTLVYDQAIENSLPRVNR